MSSYIHDIDRTRVPDHVAIVMDGNGRWAKQRGLPRTEGHGAGEEALRDTVKGAVVHRYEEVTPGNWKKVAELTPEDAAKDPGNAPAVPGAKKVD